MNWFSEKFRQPQTSIWIQEGIFLLTCFFWLFFKIHPGLMVVEQSPIFFLTADYFKELLQVPGGLADWLSALLMQFWFTDLIASIMLTICFWLILVLTKTWLRFLREKRPIHSVHLIPVGLLLIGYSQYNYSFSITIALMINLLVLILFLRWAPEGQISRTLLGLAISLLLYWTTGGAFFLFVVLMGLEELVNKRFISGPAVLIISGLFPYAAFLSFLLISLRRAYVHNLSFELPSELWYIGYLLPTFFLVTFAIASLSKNKRPLKLLGKMESLALIWKVVVGTIIIGGSTFLLSAESISSVKRHILLVNRAVMDERWSDVLGLTKHSTNETPLILNQSNLALFQSGKLLDSMFAYPQSKGTIGLIMNESESRVWSEESSNIFWKLGLVNESLHWAHEALECKGPTANILNRLGMIYMVKGENDAARHFFLNLKNIPFEGNTAEKLMRLNENPTERSNDSTYRYIQSCMPSVDLISADKLYYPELELLLMRNPRNKMAFEYLIAYHLLSANGNGVWSHIPYFQFLNYNKVPRHVQEAMIVIASMIPKFDFNTLKPWVDPVVFNHYVNFRKILTDYKEDKIAARQELHARYGDTYWYYLLYVKSAMGRSESHNEYQ